MTRLWESSSSHKTEHEKSQTEKDLALFLRVCLLRPVLVLLIELTNNHRSFPELRLSRSSLGWGRLSHRLGRLTSLSRLTTIEVVEKNRRLSLGKQTTLNNELTNSWAAVLLGKQ